MKCPTKIKKMVEGLDIHIDEFKKLNEEDRNAIMFQNIVCIRRNQKNDKLNRRLQYFWLLALTGVLGVKQLLGL